VCGVYDVMHVINLVVVVVVVVENKSSVSGWWNVHPESRKFLIYRIDGESGKRSCGEWMKLVTWFGETRTVKRQRDSGAE